MPTRTKRWIEEALVDRLATATRGLRRLFYLNLALAAAVVYLVYEDPGSAAYRINSAVQTVKPILEANERIIRLSKEPNVAKHLREMEKRIRQYWEIRNDLAQQIGSATDGFNSEQGQKILEDLTKDQRDSLENAEEFFDNFQGETLAHFFFTKKMSDSDVNDDIFGFSLLFFGYSENILRLLHLDYNTLRQVAKTLKLNIHHLLPDPQTSLNFKQLRTKLEDPALSSFLDAVGPFPEMFEAFLVITRFCGEHKIKPCSIAKIENWRREHKEKGTLTLPFFPLRAQCNVIIVVSPAVLLICLHLFLVQCRRREELKKRLNGTVSPQELRLLDESWLFGNLALLKTVDASFWAKLQRGILSMFLFSGEAIPLAGISAAFWSITQEVILDYKVIVEFKEAAEFLPLLGFKVSIPSFVTWRLFWLGTTIIFLAIGLVGVFRLWKDQWEELSSISDK